MSAGLAVSAVRKDGANGARWLHTPARRKGHGP